ncbi:alpha-(1,6)-fucosyltransferase-like [Mercenaria mercenaria]|uniref:alpha-(1,6)-fucosyltransferase-like n=1 Tax=Mercenaria mercenaria TaxID=6596 RepID=UPI00234E5848|nr:alpha-(1,6)-fucosyltransferase-like [Mercenaria mercenaria]
MPLDRSFIMDAFQFPALPGTKESDLTSAESRLRHANFSIVRKISQKKPVTGSTSLIAIYERAESQIHRIGTFSLTEQQQQQQQQQYYEVNTRPCKTEPCSMPSLNYHVMAEPKRCIGLHGFGSNVHQLTFCLIVAYATQRTLILESKDWRYAKEGWETMFLPLSRNCISTMNNSVTRTTNLSNIAHIEVIELPKMQSLTYRPTYLPLAIPEDLADNLTRIHRNPSVWWIGQIHVRRTDKKIEADYHRLEEYMDHADKWYNMHLKILSQSRYVYLTTDDPDVLKEAENKYPNYTFIYDVNACTTAKFTRYTESSLQEILFDVHMLSMCDFVICTMSSNVCRLVYELMQSRDGDASNRLISLDTDYFFRVEHPGKKFEKRFMQNSTSGVQMKGFTPVKEKRSKPSRPIFTADNKRTQVAMPVYSEREQLEPKQKFVSNVNQETD